MAELSLKHIQKIYPNLEKKRKRKKGEPEKKSNLKVTDEGVIAVEDFNLEVADGEFVVLVGPSGCGKSTTLRMVAGLEEISGGELYIGGKLMNDVAPKDRDIAMVFQSYALYPHMTVYDNLAFPLKLRKASKDEIDKKVREAAQVLGITEYLERKPKALSGGQRQRVAIGRAIVRNPKVLLMDEPLSNLDAKLRNQMRAEIIKLRQRIDTTFMYVTHDQTEAMTLGDRIVIMKDGVVQQVGTPQQVFDSPANLFVAGFIGVPQMNFFDATLSHAGARYVVKAEEISVAVSDETATKLVATGVQDGVSVVAGVRPEQMLICDKGEAGTVTGTVDVTELMGSTVHVHATTDIGQFVLIVPTVDLGGKSYTTGDEISFKFAKNAIHLFAKDTGVSLTCSQPQAQQGTVQKTYTQSQSTDAQQRGISGTSSEKSKVAAGLLAIFFGGLGVHKFYLGYTSAGIIMLLISIFGSIIWIGPILMGLCGLIEGIIYLTKSDENFQRIYVRGDRPWF